MNGNLQEAGAMARLERRRRLIRDVAHLLEFGEDVLQVAGGRAVGPHDGAVQLAVTDRRVLVVRRRAFRQVAVESYPFADCTVSYGHSAGGGVLEVRDTNRTVQVSGVVEGELESFLGACRTRLPSDRVRVLLEPAESREAEPAAAEPEGAAVVIPEAAEPAEAEPEAAEEVAQAAAEPEGAEEPEEAKPEAAEEAAEPEAVAGDTLVLQEGEGPTVVLPEAVLEPIAAESEEEEIDPAADAQGAILRWLLAKTGARATVFATSDEETGLRIEPRRLDADEVVDLLRRARAVRAGESIAEADVLAARWAGRDGPRALLLVGADPAAAAGSAAFAQFALESLEASRAVPVPDVVGRIRAVEGVAWAEAGPAGAIRALIEPSADLDEVGEEVLEIAEAQDAAVEWVGNALPRLSGDRPALAAVEVTGGAEGGPTATVRLDWMGDSTTGEGRGHTEVLGRHLAVARATAAALEPLVARRIVVEHLFVTYPPNDAELVVATVMVGARRYVGATVVQEGTEDAAGAGAVLDALNRLITRLGHRAPAEI